MIQSAQSSFDRLTAMAAAVFDTPMSVVTLLDDDRAVFRGQRGMDLITLPRGASVGTHIAELGLGGIMVLPDARLDPRSRDHPMVTGEPYVRWFVGATICTSDGVPVGALNVMDTQVERAAPTQGQIAQFRLLAEMAGDIVERERARRAQIAQLKMLSLAETMSGVGQWHVELTTGTITWSDEIYRIHGLDRATFVPSRETIVGLYPKEDHARLDSLIQAAVQVGEGYDFITPIVRTDGERRQVAVEAVVEMDHTERPAALFGVMRDVTEEREAMERLSRSEARYRLLADHMGDVITRILPSGQGAYISPASYSLVGWTPEEMAAQSSEQFVHPDDHIPLWSVTKRGFAGEGSQRLEYRLLHKRGHYVWVEGHFQAVPDGKGGVRELVVVIRDVSERKALETELIEARDRAEAGGRAKSEFLANMSHELRTPLTSVIGFSELLQQSRALPEMERRHADRIATSSKALLGVINDILDYSKLEAAGVVLDPAPFDPRALARGAADIVESQCGLKGLDLIVEVDAAVPDVLIGDEGRLRQVLLNLLSNAVKFTAAGAVTLSVGGRANAEDGWDLTVSVADTGIGIAPDKLALLFERFSQADASTTRVYGGTGLGLSISRRLVRLMGGDVAVESVSGQGSRFTFQILAQIPAQIPAAVAQAVGPVEAIETTETAAIPRQARILMADDAAANRELVSAILASQDVTLDTVCDGAEALEAARGGTYDLILMDVQMPVMDGMQATRAIRLLPDTAGRVPIVALTANVQSEQIALCLEAGMDAHLAKPIHVAELLMTVAGALSARTEAAKAA